MKKVQKYQSAILQQAIQILVKMLRFELLTFFISRQWAWNWTVCFLRIYWKN